MIFIPLFIALFFGFSIPSGKSSWGKSPTIVRFLVPHESFSLGILNELGRLVEEYQRSHSGTQIQLLRRGANFSCLKELVALHLAGDLPELALVETSEIPSLVRAGIPISISSVPGFETNVSLPFELTLPVLLMDRERVSKVPFSWKELLKTARTFQSQTLAERPLAFPLQGPRGLWLFEAWAQKPLWKKEAGGLKTNRQLIPQITALQNLQEGIIRPDETWERAVQFFLDRKSPLLITSLETLPYISKQATFAWSAGLLPSSLEGGSRLVVTKSGPEIQEFVNFLYDPEIGARRVLAGGYLPLKKNWMSTQAWKSACKKPLSPYCALVEKQKPLRSRTTDPDVVRAHSEWIQALPYLLGESSKRLSIESVFSQLDNHLSQK